jgi:hypothetical protein
MPKPEKVTDINIGANGGMNQAGRTPTTLDIQVVKPFKTDMPDIALRIVELAAAKKVADAGGSDVP